MAHDAIAKPLSVLGKVRDKSFHMNSFVDDAYRVASYLYEHDKQLKAGADTATAAANAEALIRKTFMQWDRATPIERSTFRMLFPFYTWAHHIIQYSLKYPMDHPFRAGVVSAFSRNELKDLGTGLPQSLMASLFLGHPDAHGNITSIQLSGMNPFRDVANYMTLGGWLGAMNPAISTVLEQAGVQTQGSNLYPNLQYDPQTGRLKATHPNFLQNLIYNTIPQTQLLSGLLDHTSELQDLMARDRGAGTRLALGQLGMPVLWRQYNLPQEAFKAELAREKSATDTQTQALQTGQWESAARTPSLQPLFGQLDALQRAGMQFNPAQQISQMNQLIAARVTQNA